MNVQTWAAETKTFTADSARPEELRLRLFNYPAWRVEVNGRIVSTYTQPNTGETPDSRECRDESRAGRVFSYPRPAGGGHMLDLRARVVAPLEIPIRERTWANIQLFRRVCEMSAKRILIATSNPGKLRDFTGAAATHNVSVGGLPNFSSLPTVVEDGKLSKTTRARRRSSTASPLRGKSFSQTIRALKSTPCRRSWRSLGALRRRPSSRGWSAIPTTMRTMPAFCGNFRAFLPKNARRDSFA